MSRLRYIANDEGIRGSAIKLRAACLDAGFESVELDLIYAGADIVWSTVFNKKVGVQRKTIVDFVGSWFSGRLQRQLHSLMQSVDIPCLLLEEHAFYDKESGGLVSSYGPVREGIRPMPYSSFANSVVDATLHAPGRFAVLLSPSVDYTIQWVLHDGVEYFDKEEFSGWHRLELPPQHTSPAVRMLLSWDGMGETRARAALREYHTPFEVSDHLRIGDFSVPGISRITIDKILRQGTTMYEE